eukprot:TRINITY_DN92456_c0_g1_i1.p1 TRINITY_DN92456_c0_g1~~TRINITY_DN92456_c0_g1_i1.p1  ORF type:complete len:370 (+),score=45.85 TRINITY_DN92456_c0_g1_i1:113-1222(+)
MAGETNGANGKGISAREYRIRAFLLIVTVCTYTACPITVSWAKMVPSVDDDVMVKGRPFKESSVIIVSRGLIALVGLLLCAVNGGKEAVMQCFNRDAIWMFFPAGLGWALADQSEVLAIAKIDPATYGVISQARLLGTALALLCIRGSRQTQLQWGLLFVLTLVCSSYCLVGSQNTGPSPKSAYEQLIGCLLALGKVTLSVVSGVYGEACFKAPQSPKGVAPELYVQMVQISFSSMLAAVVGYFCVGAYMDESPWEFFSGPEGHWDHRTVVVAVMYCWREWICNLCMKRFDALIKNICNAMALVTTYIFVVFICKEERLSALKVFLLLAVVAEVVNYSSTKKQGPPPATAAALGADFNVAEYSRCDKLA